MPVRRRPHRVLIPGGTFESSSASWQGGQQELALLRNKVTVQMRRLDTPVWTELVQRSRIRRHSKFQEPRLVPYLDGFCKRPRRENTVPNGANSLAGNLRANRICNPCAK